MTTEALCSKSIRRGLRNRLSQRKKSYSSSTTLLRSQQHRRLYPNRRILMAFTFRTRSESTG